jgi:hypothetical protein
MERIVGSIKNKDKEPRPILRRPRQKEVEGLFYMAKRKKEQRGAQDLATSGEATGRFA